MKFSKNFKRIQKIISKKGALTKRNAKEIEMSLKF